MKRGFIRFHLERVSNNTFRFVVEGRTNRKDKLLVLKNTCLIWQSAKNSEGYGTLGGIAYVHRLLYEKFSEPIPEGHEPDHLCRERACANPRHIEPVTRSENTRRGNRTKLTVEKVAAIRKLSLIGISQVELGRRFGVHGSHVSRILAGKYWGKLQVKERRRS